MKSRLLLAAPLLALLALPVAAQNDKITLVDGTVLTGVKVESYDMRYLRYVKGSTKETLGAEQVAKVELGKFKEVFARGLNDPDTMLTLAREQLAAKENVLAQFALLRAAEQFFDAGKAPEAVVALDELAKSLPEAGVGLDAFRLKADFYMGQGVKGMGNAQALAKKVYADAMAKGWNAAALEAQFVEVLSSRKAPKEFQAALKTVITAAAANPVITGRANVELAHSLRETKEFGEAEKIYTRIAEETKDVNARAGAMLGLAKSVLEQAKADDKEAFKKALLMFLRVRLETKSAWPGLQADALYHAILAAEKWRGPEFGLVMARCRNQLINEFGNTEWAERARSMGR